MKIKVSLESVPLSIEIEGPDVSMVDIIEFSLKTLVRMKEAYQSKLVE